MRRIRSIFIATTALPLMAANTRFSISSWCLSVIFVTVGQLALSTSVMASSLTTSPDTLEPCDPAVTKVYSKSKTILGGKLSSLATIQAAQRSNAGSSCISRSAELSELSDAATPEKPTRSIGPDAVSSFLPDFQREADLFAPIVNTVMPKRELMNLSNTHIRSPSKPAIAPRKLAMPVSSVITSFNGKPDIFGSVALKVSHTPLDKKWRGVQNNSEESIAMAALVQAGAIVGPIHKENNIRAVNRWINANISYVEDHKLYGQADYWASAGKTLKSGRGDCEDFAIAKMHLLQASGVKASDMFLVIVKDLVRRVDHSLLVVRLGNKMLVLDNETDQILNAEEVRDYRPIMSYSANRKWLHGYAIKPSDSRMASIVVSR